MDFDDPSLLSKLTTIETEHGSPFRGIPLGSVWTEDGKVREDTHAQFLGIEQAAQLAGWPVVVYETVGSREFYAAKEPMVAIHMTHSGAGDRVPVSNAPASMVRALVNALNGRGAVPAGGEDIFKMGRALASAPSQHEGKPLFAWTDP